jgi:hypothetical protein
VSPTSSCDRTPSVAIQLPLQGRWHLKMSLVGVNIQTHFKPTEARIDLPGICVHEPDPSAGRIKMSCALLTPHTSVSPTSSCTSAPSTDVQLPVKGSGDLQIRFPLLSVQIHFGPTDTKLATVPRICCQGPDPSGGFVYVMLKMFTAKTAEAKDSSIVGFVATGGALLALTSRAGKRVVVTIACPGHLLSVTFIRMA